MIGEWSNILNTYGDRTRTNAPPLELLTAASAETLAKVWNVSVRTVRAWRQQRGEKVTRYEGGTP